QLLGEALRRIGHGAVVLDDHLDLLARDRVAVLRHEQLDGRHGLAPGRLLRTRHRQDEADLDGARRVGPPAREAAGHEGRGRGEKLSAMHRYYSDTISPHSIWKAAQWKRRHRVGC